MEVKVKNIILRLLTLIPAGVLIFSAVTKTISFNEFAESNEQFLIGLTNQSINTNSLIPIVITVIILSVEIIVGILLIIRYKEPLVLTGGAILFLVFLIVNAIKILQGETDNCGCFGEVIDTSVYSIFYLDLLLFLMPLIVLKISNSKTQVI